MYVRVKRGTQTVFLRGAHGQLRGGEAKLARCVGRSTARGGGGEPAALFFLPSLSVALFQPMLGCRATRRRGGGRTRSEAARRPRLPAGRRRRVAQGAPMMTYVNNLGTWV